MFLRAMIAGCNLFFTTNMVNSVCQSVHHPKFISGSVFYDFKMYFF